MTKVLVHDNNRNVTLSIIEIKYTFIEDSMRSLTKCL